MRSRNAATFTLRDLPEILLLLVFVAVCSFCDTVVESHLDIDSHRYLELGQSLLNSGRLEHEGVDGQLIPDISRTPVYPLLIATAIAVCGGSVNAGVMAVIWLQRLAWVGAVCWALPRVWATGRRLRVWGLTGKFVLLFSPVVIYHGSLLLTDLLYAAGLLASVRLTVWGFRRGSTLHAQITGVLHGALTLLRPVHLLVPVILILPWIRQRFKLAANLVIFAMLLPAGWLLRNHEVTGYWTLSALDGRALSLHQEKSIRHMQPEQSSAAYGPEFIAALHSTDENPITAAWLLMRDYSVSEAQADQTAKQVSLEAIRRRPGYYFQQTAMNVVRLFWSKIDGYNLAQMIAPKAGEPVLRAYGWANALWSTVMFFVLPVWLLTRKMPRRLLMSRTGIACILIVIYMVIVPAMTTVTYGRFALPLLPFIGLVYCVADTRPVRR